MLKRLVPTIIFLFSQMHSGAAPMLPSRAEEPAPRYDLAVQVVPDAHRLEATGTVQLPAGEEPRAELRLVLSELMRDFSVDVLRPAVSAGPARLEKKEARNGDGIWIVEPRQPFPAGETVLLRFSYAGGEQVGFVFHIGPEVSVACAHNTHWYPLMDRDGAVRGNGTLRLSVPAGYTAVADEGNRISKHEEAGREIFQFEIVHPTFFTFVVGKFTEFRRDGAVPLAVYLLRPRQNIEKYLDSGSGILETIAQEFGPFPYKQAMLVETTREVSQKASFDGFAFAGGMVIQGGSFDKPEFNIDLPYLAHELGHQWFPLSVGITVDQKGGRYVAEGLAQYASLRAVEKLIGPQAAKQYRSSGLPTWGEGAFGGLGYFQIAAAGLDYLVGDLPPAQNGERLQNQKGFFVWDMLSREVGQEKFRRILHGITRQHAFSQLSWTGFLRAIEAGAGMDLHGFYDQWFYRTGAPEWELTWKQEGDTWRGVITQSLPYYQVKVEVQAEASDGRRLIHEVEISGPRTEFAWPFPFRVKSVDVDPNYFVLHWTPEFRAIATAFIPYTQERRKQTQGETADVEKGLRVALEQVPNPDLYGIRFMLEYRLGQLLTDKDQAKKQKRNACQQID